jgi:copper chaperone CopZ
MQMVVRLITSLGVLSALIFEVGCSNGTTTDRRSPQTQAQVSTVAITVEGMTCPSCSVAVRTALKRQAGVRAARVSTEDKRAVVEYEPATVTPQRLVDVVNGLGYHASLAQPGS